MKEAFFEAKWGINFMIQAESVAKGGIDFMIQAESVAKWGIDFMIQAESEAKWGNNQMTKGQLNVVSGQGNTFRLPLFPAFSPFFTTIMQRGHPRATGQPMLNVCLYRYYVVYLTDTFIQKD